LTDEGRVDTNVRLLDVGRGKRDLLQQFLENGVQPPRSDVLAAGGSPRAGDSGQLGESSLP